MKIALYTNDSKPFASIIGKAIQKPPFWAYMLGLKSVQKFKEKNPLRTVTCLHCGEAFDTNLAAARSHDFKFAAHWECVEEKANDFWSKIEKDKKEAEILNIVLDKLEPLIEEAIIKLKNEGKI